MDVSDLTLALFNYVVLILKIQISFLNDITV